MPDHFTCQWESSNLLHKTLGMLGASSSNSAVKGLICIAFECIYFYKHPILTIDLMHNDLFVTVGEVTSQIQQIFAKHSGTGSHRLYKIIRSIAFNIFV